MVFINVVLRLNNDEHNLLWLNFWDVPPHPVFPSLKSSFSFNGSWTWFSFSLYILQIYAGAPHALFLNLVAARNSTHHSGLGHLCLNLVPLVFIVWQCTDRHFQRPHIVVFPTALRQIVQRCRSPSLGTPNFPFASAEDVLVTHLLALILSMIINDSYICFALGYDHSFLIRLCNSYSSWAFTIWRWEAHCCLALIFDSDRLNIKIQQSCNFSFQPIL